MDVVTVRFLCSRRFTPSSSTTASLCTRSSRLSMTSYQTGPPVLPPEIVECVLDLISPPDAHAETAVKLARQEMSACSLTSKHWALRMRPMLFKRIALRNRDDLRTLAEFLDSATSRLPDYLEELAVEYTAENPWLHLLFSAIQPKLSAPRRTTLRVRLTLGPYLQVTGGCLFGGLPHNVPHISRLKIHTLSLSWVRVRSFLDLALLIGSLPFLETIYCVGLTCVDGSKAPSSLSPATRPIPGLRTVVVLRCFFSTDALLFILQGRRTAAAPSMTGPTSYLVPNDRRPLLHRLVGSIGSAAITSNEGFFGTSYPLTRYDVVRGCQYTDIVYRSMQSGIPIFDRMIALPVVTITLHSPSSAPHTSNRITVTIDFHVKGRAMLRSSNKCDWASFLSALSALETHLTALNIGFTSPRDQQTFYGSDISTSARAVLDHMTSEGKVCYGYWNSEGEEWVGVSDHRPLGIEFSQHFYGSLDSKEETIMVDERYRLLNMEPRRRHWK